MRAIIIDDVDAIRQKNSDVILENCPGIVIVAEADSVASGVEAIRKLQPDLVFLDVEMADGTGFDLLNELQPIQFKVIFITGFQEFAIQAFRFSAIDFLLKPIDPDELVEAVAKVSEALNQEIFELKLSTLFSNIRQPEKLQKLVLKTSQKVYPIMVSDIIRCEGHKNSTTFYLINGEQMSVTTALKEYELMLVPLQFFRPHRSHLINMQYFDHYTKKDGFIIMKDKSAVPLATRKREDFFELLDIDN